MASPVPVQKATIEETLEALCKDFKLDDKVKTGLLATGVQDLEEFRYYFVKEEEVGILVAKIEGLEDKSLQGARLRRAWQAVRQMGGLRDAGKTASSNVDLDDLLDEDALRDVKSTFWKRHKLRFPADVMPSDSLVSRCSR